MMIDDDELYAHVACYVYTQVYHRSYMSHAISTQVYHRSVVACDYMSPNLSYDL